MCNIGKQKQKESTVHVPSWAVSGFSFGGITACIKVFDQMITLTVYSTGPIGKVKFVFVDYSSSTKS